MGAPIDPFHRPEYARQFFWLGIGVVILILGLTTIETSLAVLTFIMYTSILVLVLFYRSLDDRR